MSSSHHDKHKPKLKTLRVSSEEFIKILTGLSGLENRTIRVKQIKPGLFVMYLQVGGSTISAITNEKTLAMLDRANIRLKGDLPWRMIATYKPLRNLEPLVALRSRRKNRKQKH